MRTLIKYRELLLFFVWRDILIRYKQAVLGIFWALIRPLLNMVLFVIVFQKIAAFETVAPYPLFVLAGLIPWQFMASNIQSSSMSLVQNTVLIQKASFPRIFLPVSTVMVNLMDSLIAFCFFFPLVLIFYEMPFKALYLFPCMMTLLLALCLGISLWCSALTVRFRDLVIAIPYLIQIGVFISPIGFSTELFPEALRPIFLLNPLVGIIDGFRYALLNEASSLMYLSLPYSIAMTSLLLVTGYQYFKRVETYLADTI